MYSVTFLYCHMPTFSMAVYIPIRSPIHLECLLSVCWFLVSINGLSFYPSPLISYTCIVYCNVWWSQLASLYLQMAHILSHLRAWLNIWEILKIVSPNVVWTAILFDTILQGEWLTLVSDSGSIGYCFPENNRVSYELVYFCTLNEWSKDTAWGVKGTRAHREREMCPSIDKYSFRSMNPLFSDTIWTHNYCLFDDFRLVFLLLSSTECIYRKRLSVDGKPINLQLYDPCSQVRLQMEQI